MTYQEFLDQTAEYLDALGPTQVALMLSQKFGKSPEIIARVLYKQFHLEPPKIAGALLSEHGMNLPIEDVITIFMHVPELQMNLRNMVEMLCDYQDTNRSYEEVARALRNSSHLFPTLTVEHIAEIFHGAPISLSLAQLIQILRSPEGLGLSADDALEIVAKLDYCE